MLGIVRILFKNGDTRTLHTVTSIDKMWNPYYQNGEGYCWLVIRGPNTLMFACDDIYALFVGRP